MRSTFRSLLAPLTLLVSLLGACRAEDSASVDQDRIYADYWIYYDADTDVTTVRASFRLGHGLGTLLQLNDPASVRFDGMPLVWNADLGTHERRIAGFRDGGTFEYVDVDGNLFVNTIDAVPTIALAAEPIELDRSRAVAVGWQGAPIGVDESVVVGIRTDAVLDVQLGTERSVGATEVLLTADQLQRIPAGRAMLGIQRFHQFPVQDATSAGAHVWSTYTAASREVRVR